MKFDPRARLTPVDYRLACYLGLLFLLMGLLVFGGHLYTGDGESYFIVALKMILGQSPTIPEFLHGFAAEGPGGQLYSKFPPGLSILISPLLGVGLAIGGVISGGGLGGGQLRAITLLVGPISGSIGMALLYLFQRRLSVVRPAAVISTLFCCTGGLALVYTRFLLPELPLAVFFLVVCWGFVRQDVVGDWWIGLGSAMAVLLRYDALAFVGPILLVRFLRTGRWLRMFLPMAGSFLLLGYYNFTRFGHPLLVGMGSSGVEEFSTPLLLGTYGQFFAAGNGLFVYAPYLGAVLAIAGFFYVHRIIKSPQVLTILIASGLFIGVHASWYSWMGGWSWGPRRMIPLILVAHLPLGLIWHRLGRATQWLIGGLWGLSVFINLPGLLTDFNDYYEGTFYRMDVLFEPTHAQVPGQWLGLLSGRFPVDVFWSWGMNSGGWIVMGLLMAGIVTLIAGLYRTLMTSGAS